MARDNIKWNLKAFEALRRDPEMDRELQAFVNGMLEQLPEGYDGEVDHGRTRSRGAVWTRDFEAILDNARNNSLLKAAENQGGRT